MKQPRILIVILVLIILIGWQGYRLMTRSDNNSSQVNRNTVVPVEVAPVQVAAIRDLVTFTGSLQAISYVVIAPKISGRLEKLMVDIGDTVTQNELIATLDDDEYTQQVQQAKAELDLAQANVEEAYSSLEVAKRDFERTQALNKENFVSDSDLDTADARYKAQNAKYKVALAQVKQKIAELKTAEVRLSYTKIHAVWKDTSDTRIVGERFVDEGAMLTANSPIVSILDIHTIIAVIYVTDRDYSRLQIGQTAIITTDSLPNTKFTGKIVRIAPMLKENSRQAKVEIEIPNPDQILKPGMFIRAEIEFAKHDNATIVPIACLVKRDGHQGVFLVDSKTIKARFVSVKLGIVNGTSAEIVSPSISGLVVVLGQHLLEDGSAIRFTEETNEKK